MARNAVRSNIDHLVYDRIHRAILEQRLPPGTKLGEESLSSLFDVSRARVWRILLRLAHDESVELRPNRGAYVAQPSAQDAREVFTARRIVEGVANGFPTAARQRLERHLAREQAAHARHDRPAAVRLSGEFHLLLAHVAGNRVLTWFLRELVARTSLIIAVYEGPGSSCCACDEHQALLAELEAGRVQDAVDLMTRHLQGIEGRLNLDRTPRTPVDLRDVFGKPARNGLAS